MSTPSAAERRLESILKIVAVAIVTGKAPADEDLASLKVFAEINDEPEDAPVETPPAEPAVETPPAEPAVETPPAEPVPDPQPSVTLADVAPDAPTGDLSA